MKEKIKAALIKERFTTIGNLAMFAVNGVEITSDIIIEAQAEAIMQLLPRWIPVSERLPEEDGDFLVTDGYNNKVYVNYFIDGIAQYTGNETLIAWMPLPKPYKAE